MFGIMRKSDQYQGIEMFNFQGMQEFEFKGVKATLLQMLDQQGGSKKQK